MTEAFQRVVTVVRPTVAEFPEDKPQFPWVGVVNRSQADINKSVDMVVARRREREYFSSNPDYKHLAHRMGSEHLAKILSKVSCLFLECLIASLYIMLIIMRTDTMHYSQSWLSI